jgi:SAM-dependent methyltransferase/GNAT superfamily N-acetyltransferase
MIDFISYIGRLVTSLKKKEVPCEAPLPRADLKFYTKRCFSMTDVEVFDSSKLFSEHYGVYSSAAKDGKAGRRIVLGSGYYRDLMKNENNHVAMCYLGDVLIGVAFYLRKRTSFGVASWVLQLVVHSDYRRMGVGKRLLQSIWGFSNDRAWGLATANPLTIKTLESSTFRKVNPKTIAKNIDIILELVDDVSFVEKTSVVVSGDSSIVDTKFYADHSSIPELLNKFSDWNLGNIEEGEEWLAFVFQGQQERALSVEEFESLIAHSEANLRDAYLRMDMPSHSWAKHTRGEVDYIIKNVPLGKGAKIGDFGCGVGRHVKEFVDRGYCNVVGIDFSLREDLKHGEYGSYFVEGDCRHYGDEKFDLIVCLYDVIGSFPGYEDNFDILKNIYNSLNGGGYAVVSVMNKELTLNIAKHVVDDVRKNMKRLLKLKPSNIMQSTGDVFNPEFFLYDSSVDVFYRKEQFSEDGYLSAEYIIRDKRYSMGDVVSMVKEVGFSVVDSRYVQAGKWGIPLKNTDMKAKEILLVLKK